MYPQSSFFEAISNPIFQDYFTNRQDRYVVVENCPQLANYFENLTKEISDFSFKVNYRPDQGSML